MRRQAMTAALAAAIAVALGCGTTAGAAPRPAGHGTPALDARDDAWTVRAGRTLAVGGHGVLGNDSGRPVTLVSHTGPAHGSLALDQDGSFRYTPAPGFTGTDTFTYSVSDAVRLYRTDLPPLATVGGVDITGGGYGS